MRRDVLYQYDLPIEVLDDVGEHEEVLDVLYARTKEKYLIPILITKLRMLWGYPERETVYRVYDMQYVDLISMHVKFAGISSAITITTVNGQKYQFKNLKSSMEEIRAGLLTLADLMRQTTCMNWQVSQRKNILGEEYLLQETGNLPVPEEPADEDDLFEEAPLPGKGCFESTETMFSHFPDKDEKMSSALVDRVARLIHTTEEEAKEAEQENEQTAAPAENDAVIFEKDSGKSDEQWHDAGGGDAMILPGRVPLRMPSRKIGPKNESEVFTIEDDDSEVYTSTAPAAEAAAAEAEPSKKEEIVIIGEPMLNTKPRTKPLVVPTPPVVAGRVIVAEVQPLLTLEPKEGVDDTTIDKSLDALKFLRENGVISEEEYKDRSLRLFKKNEK